MGIGLPYGMGAMNYAMGSGYPGYGYGARLSPYGFGGSLARAMYPFCKQALCADINSLRS